MQLLCLSQVLHVTTPLKKEPSIGARNAKDSGQLMQTLFFVPCLLCSAPILLLIQ